jgi:putative tricarboxylic transport membrane protein
MEKRFAKRPEKFGQGAIEGVAGPESANNSCFAGGMVPLSVSGSRPVLSRRALCRDDPASAWSLSRCRHPEVFWGLIASMYLGNICSLYQPSSNQAVGTGAEGSPVAPFSSHSSFLS